MKISVKDGYPKSGFSYSSVTVATVHLSGKRTTTAVSHIFNYFTEPYNLLDFNFGCHLDDLSINIGFALINS